MKKLKYLFVIIFCVNLISCNDDASHEHSKNIEKIDFLWDETVSVYLQDELWNPVYNYDAGQLLMIPMHYAFAEQDQNKILQFDSFYDYYSQIMNEQLDTNRLRQLQFWYLASQYLLLSSKQGNWDNNKQEIYNSITLYLDNLWTERPISVWGIATNGLKERVVWKLENKDYVPRYKRATFDEEFYTFAIAADFIVIKNNQFFKENSVLTDILFYAEKVFKSEAKPTDAGWLYQPGQWADNDDYLYAGNIILTDDLKPKPIVDIATDSSHSHRMPLWLTSLRNAYSINSEQYNYYQNLINGFTEQFMKVVYVDADDDFQGMRMKNFMDGNNGIYRYRFHEDSTTAIKLGYEPYNLSGTLFTGFYPLLQSSILKEKYKTQCDMFPLNQNLIDLYMGLGPARASHHLVSMPDFYTNGFAELVCLIAVQLPPDF